MSKNRITEATRLTILKHLANGKSLEVVAEITKLGRFEVLDVASHHGYPDLGKVAKAAVLVDGRIRRDSLAQLETPYNPTATTATPASDVDDQAA